MSGLEQRELRFIPEAEWRLARLAVQGAAEQAAELRVPQLAGRLTMRVLAGLRGNVGSGLDGPLARAEEVAAEAARDIQAMARRAAEQGTRAAIASVTSWQRLAPGAVCTLESVALAAAECASHRALQAAGSLSVTLLAEAQVLRRSGRRRPTGLCARAAARVWIGWLATGHSASPRLAEGLLRWVLPARDRQFLLADLDEELEAIVSRHGLRAARAWYWRQALGSVVPLGRMRLAEVLGRFRRLHPD
jgi:hypothetical protein